MEGLLPARNGKPEWVSARNRLFFDGVLWVARTGVPWRDFVGTVRPLELGLEAVRSLGEEGDLVGGI